MTLNKYNCIDTQSKSLQNWRANQDGAVLLMVLVVIVSLSIAIGVATRIINQRVATAFDSKENIETLMQSQAKLAELTYLLATQRITAAGVSQSSAITSQIDADDPLQQFSILPIGDEIRTDGFEYTQNGLRYSLQNQAGLLAVNTAEQMWLEKYLNEQGLSRLQVQTLLDSLADYADENDTRRAAGAESFAYGGSSVFDQTTRLPRNYLLQSCGELHLIKHWQAQEDLINQLVPLCSTLRVPRMNINSMPLPLLQTLFGQQAEQIWQNRLNNQWPTSEAALANNIPSIFNYDPNYYAVVSGSEYIIDVGTLDVSRPTERLHIKLGRGNLAPFTYK